MNEIETIDEFEQMLQRINIDEVYIKQLFDIYHSRLLNDATACNKLARRGISHEAIIQYHLGYCDRSLNRYIKTSSTAEGASFRHVLKCAGLITANGHEVFRGCIVEPIYHEGTLLAVCGIKLICPSRPAPRIIQWFNGAMYPKPLAFHLMKWGARYVTH
ncbi:MAG: hypothetical protein MK175_13960 [Pseudoalteromonas sp.]|uniref:hypothetical protein n=1 Tax=Pseudoalteromonas sp. TaxID=53249 RepID=UPI0025F39D23|nr:hypothetical protein [Pseudoalteromonas sp.]MCH2088285.1 hypothetical protein [Pseudoalteromonas sp.]